MNGFSGKSLSFVRGAAILLGLIQTLRPPACFAAVHGSLAVPEQLASVVYRQNQTSPRQIYIVAQSHRSVLSGEKGDDTEIVQEEIYRIGAWLIRHEGVTVLLPEGYFRKHAASAAPARECRQTAAPRDNPVSDADLRIRLSDPARYVNAGMLLKADYELSLRQIEDRGVYANVCLLLRELAASKPADRQNLAEALDNQQRLRSGILLENIPEVLQYGKGDCPENAMLTVGFAHLGEMIDLLRKGAAENATPDAGDLRSLTENFGITVLLPRTLAQDRELCNLVLPNSLRP